MAAKTNELHTLSAKAGDELQIHYVPLKQLANHFLEKNSKKHDMGTLHASVERYSFRDPIAFDITLNGGKGGIVEGNGRLEMLCQLCENGFDAPKGIKSKDGEWYVPCIFGVDAASEEEAVAYSISHNLSSLWGADGLTFLDSAKLFDQELLQNQLTELADVSIDFLPVGIDTADLELLLEMADQGEPEKAEEDEESLNDLLDKAEDGKIESRVKLGEIWQLGRHKICCGDSTREENIRQVLDGKTPQMFFCDPPYGISIVATNGYVGGGECNRTSIDECAAKRLGTSHGSKPFGSKDVRGSDGASNVVEVNKYMPIIGDETIDTAINSFNAAYAVNKDAVHIWWGGNYYSSSLPNSSCWLIWDKENTGNFADAELAWTNQPTATRIFKHMWNGMVKASEHGQRRVHPTQKPKKLFQWCSEKYGNSNDLVVDQFLGSGMSLMAAQEMEDDRTVFGFELSEAYCEIICQRFQTLTGIEPKLVGHL